MMMIMMNPKNMKEEKKKYEEIVKLVQKAQKEAAKFVEKNMKLDPQLKAKYV